MSQNVYLDAVMIFLLVTSVQFTIKNFLPGEGRVLRFRTPPPPLPKRPSRWRKPTSIYIFKLQIINAKYLSFKTLQ